MTTEQQTVTRIKDTVINGSMTEAVGILREHQIDHYTNRLKAELEAGNTPAVKFLRSELHNLKKLAHA